MRGCDGEELPSSSSNSPVRKTSICGAGRSGGIKTSSGPGYGGGAATTCEAAAGKRHISISKSLAQHAFVLLAIRSVKRAMRIVGSHNEPLAGGPSQAAASPIPTTFWWPRAPASPSASGLRLVSRLRFRDGILPSLPVPAPPIRPHRPGQRHRPVPNTQRLRVHPRRLCGAPSPAASARRRRWSSLAGNVQTEIPLASSYTLLAPRGMLRSSCKCLLARLLRRSVAIMEANARFRLPRCSTSRVATSSRLVSSRFYAIPADA